MKVNDLSNQPKLSIGIASAESGTSIASEAKSVSQKAKTQKENTQVNSEIKDEFVVSENQKKVTYSKPSAADRSSLIQKLKDDSNKRYQGLREMVRQLLERQGMSFRDLDGFEGEVAIDEETRLAAQAAIAEGGEYSAENVSDRIVEFAKAVSNGDKSKLDKLRSAIDKGFEQAKGILGGKLPEISQKTYSLIMEKLDAWMKEE